MARARLCPVSEQAYIAPEALKFHPGIDEGLLKMSIGETRRISIPSPMGGDKADDIVLGRPLFADVDISV